MTLRVLITGTSHCAALRSAVRPDADGQLRHGALRLHFAAVPGGLFAQMYVKGSVLTATRGPARRAFRRLNGADRFDLADFDAVVLCGGLLNSFAITRLHGSSRWFPLPSLVAAGGVPPPGLALISEAAALAFLGEEAATMPMAPLLSALSAMGTPPIMVVQEPRLSEDAVGAGAKYLGFTRIARGPDAAALSALYDRASVAAPGPRVRVVLQPQASRGRDFFTAAVYRRDAVRMTPGPDVPQSAADMLHGNAAYGGLVLDDLAQALGVAGRG